MTVWNKLAEHGELTLLYRMRTWLINQARAFFIRRAVWPPAAFDQSLKSLLVVDLGAIATGPDGG